MAISSRQKRYEFLIARGFFPLEARQLSRVSRGGMKAPYFKRMSNSRKRLYDNAVRYGWSETKYRDYIRQMYIDNGLYNRDILGRIRIDVWQLLRYYEEQTYARGEEYESPWRIKRRKKQEKRRSRARVTKRQMLNSWISDLDRSISRTNSQSKKDQFEKQKVNLQRQL